ncbi:MAG: TraR/DksA C4-type zinc finger protein [Gemmatimonadaceae bacterium]|nr:TraR/DksA C4-type zinc finger protein [Gemmatimonadaceae bacterium]
MTARAFRRDALPEQGGALTAEQRRDLHEQLLRAQRRLERARAAGIDVDREMDETLGALARMRDDRYGWCTRCGAPIPLGRLLVMPETTHCVGCP